MAAPPILKSGIRILRADEYDGLREGGQKDKIDVCLYTGMRYIELRRFHDNPSWFDIRGFVFLPAQAILKAKRRQLERWVKLNQQGLRAVKSFLEIKQNLPTWQVWTEDLRRWATKSNLDPIGLSPKTMRKTWESWLMATYPERMAEICLSQGHTSFTALKHYLNMPFLPEDKEKMKPYVEGFF